MNDSSGLAISNGHFKYYASFMYSTCKLKRLVSVPIENREPPGHHHGVEAEGGHQVLTTLKQITASNIQKN
jgi:hypothetical protein